MKQSPKVDMNLIYRQLKTLPLPQIIKLELIKLGYKVEKKTLPRPLQNIFNKKGGEKTHRYLTRNKNLPNIQAHTNSAFNNSYVCRCISEYTKLPHRNKQAVSLKALTRGVKKELLMA